MGIGTADWLVDHRAHLSAFVSGGGELTFPTEDHSDFGFGETSLLLKLAKI